MPTWQKLAYAALPHRVINKTFICLELVRCSLRLTYFPAALVVAACAAFAACSSSTQIVPANGTRLPQSIVGNPDTGGGDGGVPTPSPTPDASGQKACRYAGGTFYDNVGGTGVTCAGGPDGPGATTSYNAKCNYTIQMTKGHGTISRGGSLLGEFSKGIEVYNSDCSYNMYS
jgi:hypothetical protein